MSSPYFYTAFHLNLAFSSIEEKDHYTVIQKCYWPLLKLAENGIPIGIEATSYTLQAILSVDPTWIATFKQLLNEGKAELIGSGFTQMIAPLVPAEVTRWNLKLGLEDYQEILGVTPEIALVNEQAYSSGILPLYKEAGFKAVMMDWAEPASHHPEWPASIMHRPAMLEGQDNVLLPVLWSDAISFQKFQRYAHGEIEADEYLEFINLQLAKGVQAFPLYTSDGEVFDYRPGRFEAESKLSGAVEHARIEMLFKTLEAQNEMEIVLPSKALSLLDNAETSIRLETPAVPVPVKKQRKYNITRWGVTGRADLQLNTHCWRQFEKLKNNEEGTARDWRELCGIWASDFRTHITEERWDNLLKKLPEIKANRAVLKQGHIQDIYRVSRDRRFLTVECGDLHLVLNLYRGMAIQAFGFGDYAGSEGGAPAANSLIGTLAHGYYDDISFGADFYSGHMVCEPGNSHKVTDLSNLEPEIYGSDGLLVIEGTVQTRWGPLFKRLVLDANSSRLEVFYDAEWLDQVEGSLRLGNITLVPEAFDRETLYYEVANGGDKREKFPISFPIEQGKSVSRLVSSSSALGMTDGVIELGDATKAMTLECRRSDIAALGMVHAQEVASNYFVRVMLSAHESDETSTRGAGDITSYVSPLNYTYSISLKKHSKPL
ncbi:hypothetical protein KFE96_12315 [Kordiimonas sp. SCSIO 12603]|uniref:hypothetical protein n=1 Tax=Kordiimonas sp. SCSIO 12603 TaxID=2829596 RepID=UPI0021055863|nr:hypothetical protein [Kordiimonas sp. SCSIO 12603]UTW57620.1 hypothetical protein KFE96_12315 [Kordiimonas sp. SCSIO 12603]